MKVTYFAKTNTRGEEKIFGIKKEDRRYHMYIVGKTGMGKSTLLLNMILSDIYADEGLCVLDPHGDLAEKILDYIPKRRINDTIYFNPADIDYPISLNVMEKGKKHLVCSQLISIFKRFFKEFWGFRLEHILRNTILSLLEYKGATTLLSVQRMLLDREYRRRIVERIEDPILINFWRNEFPKYCVRFSETMTPILNKLGQFLTNPLIRNIVGQTKNRIDFRELMDDGKILIANLSKGMIGEDCSSLLGSLILMKIQLAGLSRQELKEEERRDFYLYIDECHSFITDSFVSMLSEARKYGICLILANQFISQIDDEMRNSILGNVGTLIAFKVGVEDAECLRKELYEFREKDLTNQPKYHIYLKLAVNGKTTSPFSAYTLPPFYGFKFQGNREKIIKVSRQRYAVERDVVEEKIRKLFEPRRR